MEIKKKIGRGLSFPKKGQKSNAQKRIRYEKKNLSTY